MKTHRLIIALASTLASTTSAAAQTRPEPRAFNAYVEYEDAPEFTAGDWVGAFLSGEAGLAVGGTAGAVVGFAMAGPCHEDDEPADPDEWQLLGPCAFHGWDEAGVGALIASPPFIAGGIALYGSARGHKGSYWASLGGSYLGMAAAVGVIALTVDNAEADLEGLGVVAVLTLPAIGGTFAYYLSRDTSPTPIIRSGALLDVGGDGVVRLSFPAIGVTRTADDLAVSVTLLGGAL